MRQSEGNIVKPSMASLTDGAADGMLAGSTQPRRSLRNSPNSRLASGPQGERLAATADRFAHCHCMDDQDSELDRLLAAERVTFDRCQRLKGFSAEVQAAAEALWQEAAQAVRDYRAKHP